MIMKARLPLPDSEKNSNKENILNYSKLENKIEVETKINHQGEVNKARAMPQEDKYHIIATKTSSGEVHIFDYYKHPPRPTDNVIRPDLRLLGHSKEGYGLNWNHIREGLLLSGADDHRICVWDINSNQNNMTPVKTYEEHKSIVEDVCWSKHHENVFATVGDDRKLILWDLRQDKPTSTVEAHTQEVNSIDYNPKVETLLITASSDKTIALWDIRNLGIKLHSFDHHKNEVSAARWNPKLTTLFASYSSDRRVNVWDLNKIGKEQSAIDAEDGPVELLV